MAYTPMEHMTNGELFEDVQVNQLIDNTAANHTEIQRLKTSKQDVIDDLANIREGSQKGLTALQPGSISDWAMQDEKPSYTASEVGALPANTQVGDENIIESISVNGEPLEVVNKNVNIPISSSQEPQGDSGIEILTYSEQAVHGESVAQGLVQRVGRICIMYLNSVETESDWQEMRYGLPFIPDRGYVALINDKRTYQGTSFNISIDPDELCIVLTKEDDTNWDGETIAFKIEYVIDETEL